MERLKILTDIPHASPALIEDIFRHATRPVIATHTGVKAMCQDSPRNLTDKQIRRIAESRGVVGIGFWPSAICTTGVEGIVKAIRHVVNLVGEDYVALGSDFGGSVSAPFSAAQMVVLTQALLNTKFTRPQIKKVMGGNVKRLFLDNLPANRYGHTVTLFQVVFMGLRYNAHRDSPIA